MTSPSDAKCCFCFNLRIGVLVYLGLSIVLSATSVVTMSSLLQIGGSSSPASNVIGVVVNLVFVGLMLYFAAKRMNTAYKVCVYIQMILYILLVAVVVLFIASGMLGLPASRSSSDGESATRGVLAIVPPIAFVVVILLIQGYCLSMLWRYMGVMQDEIAERKQKQVTA